MRSNPLSERKDPRFFPVYAAIDRPFSRALNICTGCPTIKTAPIPVKAKFIIFPPSMSIAHKTRRFSCRAADSDLTALAQGRTIDTGKLRFAERSLFDSQQIARIYRDDGLFLAQSKSRTTPRAHYACCHNRHHKRQLRPQRAELSVFGRRASCHDDKINPLALFPM